MIEIDTQCLNLFEKKQILREKARAKRKRLMPAVRHHAALLIAEHLLTLSQSWPPSLIAGYCSMGSEVDVMPALLRLEQAGHHLALPSVTQDGLVFRTYRSNDPLQAGPLNTREPLPEHPACRPQVVLVPLLAFDHSLMRLGQGAGFYDRALAQLRQSGPLHTIGIAFACQMTDTPIPAEPHDQSLDWVVTENGLHASRSPHQPPHGADQL